MSADLLEREDALEVLEAALDEACGGAGSVVLLHGEAGLGKTSVVRAFARAADGRARTLTGGCEDMVTPRPLGAIHDAVRARRGPLRDAVLSGDRDAILAGARAELSTAPQPTVLVVEDAQWADGATLDILRYLGRRVEELTGVLLVTYRDDEIGPDHALHAVLGVLVGPRVRRHRLRPLSPAAVSRLDHRDQDPAALHRLTGGNPFFLSEVLASPQVAVPPTVRDAVLARMRRLDPGTQAALEQLSVVPSQVELPLGRALVPDLGVLAEAERLGVLEVRPQAVAFRHELARRALEGSVPVSRRLQLNAAVLTRLLAASPPDEARIVHHAIQAGDDEAVVTHAPAAARQAGAAGAHRQARWLYEAVLERAPRLDPAAAAEIHEEYAWTLFNLNLADEAVDAAEAAVRRREEDGATPELGRALAASALLQWAGLRVGAAQESAERAITLLAGADDGEAQVTALTYVGMTLVNVDREREGLEHLDDALAMAGRRGAAHLVPRALLYRGRARAQRGETGGVEEIREAVRLARAVPDHSTVLLGLLNAVMTGWELGRYDEVRADLDEAEAYARDKDLPVAGVGLEVYRQRWAALHGDHDGALEALSRLNRGDNYAAASRLVLPALSRVVVRQGRDDADAVVAAAWSAARVADTLLALAPAGLASLEHAWLTGRAGERVDEIADVLLARASGPGWAHARGETLRWLRRLGRDAASFDGCPEPLAAGLRGDRRAAAAAWDRLGAPYERALEMAESDDTDVLGEALAVLDGIGARPAAGLVRTRLRRLGVVSIPRGPQRATRANPAGLTERQTEILRLLAEGLANTEIAARLVLSVRTVDHHVSAILTKLHAPTRHAAVQAAQRLGVLADA